MFLTLKKYPLLFSIKSRRRAEAPPPPCTPFDETLIVALKSLPPLPPSLTLAWLSAAANLLSSTLSSAATLISHLTPPASDLAGHLKASDAVIDACNDISSLLYAVSRRRLLLLLAIHSGDRRKARAAIAEFQSPPVRQIRCSPTDLIFNIRRSKSGPPRKISAVRRAICAVEALATLVGAAAVVVLGGAEKPDLARIRASAEFPWAEAFNKVAVAVYGKLEGGGAGEVEAAERKARELAAVMDGGEEGEGMRRAVDELKAATEKLTEGVERLSNGVDGVFRAAVTVSNAAMMCFQNYSSGEKHELIAAFCKFSQ